MILLVMTEQARAILAQILVNGLIDGFTVRADVREGFYDRAVYLSFSYGLYTFGKRLHLAHLEQFEDPAGYVELVREEFWIARNQRLDEIKRAKEE